MKLAVLILLTLTAGGALVYYGRRQGDGSLKTTLVLGAGIALLLLGLVWSVFFIVNLAQTGV